jgi:dephospho-CoA kinase
VDRAALAAIVFSDPAALGGLEAVVHPTVRRDLLETLGGPDAHAAPFVVIEAIKLIEGGLAELCDEVWLIACTADEQRSRLLGRGMSPQDAARRMSAQGADLAARLAAAATRTIDASGSRESVRERVEDALADALAAVSWSLPVRQGEDRP